MTDRKRRLIFHWTYDAWGGAQIYFLAIMKRARSEWDIIVILPRTSQPNILAFLDEIGVRYEFIDACADVGNAPTLGQKLRRQWRPLRAELESYPQLTRYDLAECVFHTETAP